MYSCDSWAGCVQGSGCSMGGRSPRFAGEGVRRTRAHSRVAAGWHAPEPCFPPQGPVPAGERGPELGLSPPAVFPPSHGSPAPASWRVTVTFPLCPRPRLWGEC